MLVKKLIIFILFPLFFISCSNLNFINEKDIFFYGKQLEIGDILIKEKKFNLTSIFGHSAIVVDENMVGDLPKIGEKYYQISLKEWLEDDRKVLALRYKDIDSTFKEKLLENIKKYSNISYGIPINKLNTNYMYCSQYIWFLYYKTAQDLGYHLDLDGDQGFFIFPYDFIESKYLININF